MLLAALLDAGAELEALARVPARSASRACEIGVERVERHGIGALHVRIARARRARRIAPTATSASSSSAADLPERVRARSLEAFAAPRRGRGPRPRRRLPRTSTSTSSARSTRSSTSAGVRAARRARRRARRLARRFRSRAGSSTAAHGVLPLPAPATLGLLEGAALVGVDTEAELVTPTGAAIAATIVEEWGALPPLTLEGVGYGAGTKDLADRPNVVRSCSARVGASDGAGRRCSRRTSTTSRPSSSRTRSSAALRRARSTSGRCRRR